MCDHTTVYLNSRPVQLGDHRLMLRLGQSRSPAHPNHLNFFLGVSTLDQMYSAIDWPLHRSPKRQPNCGLKAISAGDVCPKAPDIEISPDAVRAAEENGSDLAQGIARPLDVQCAPMEYRGIRYISRWDSATRMVRGIIPLALNNRKVR